MKHITQEGKLRYRNMASEEKKKLFKNNKNNANKNKQQSQMSKLWDKNIKVVISNWVKMEGGEKDY